MAGATEKPSAHFLGVASRLSKTGHGYLLSSHFDKYKLSAGIPLSYKDVGLSEPHPVLAVHDFVQSMSKNEKLEHLFMGNGPKQYLDFWEKWRKQQPKHPVYAEHASHLSECVPVSIHCDEGTSQKKKGLMIIQVQPCLGRGTSKRKATETEPGVNYLGKSLVTRWLFSVMLTRVYSGKK